MNARQFAPDEPSMIDFAAVRARVAPHVYHTPLLTSRTLSERTGFDVRLKASASISCAR